MQTFDLGHLITALLLGLGMFIWVAQIAVLAYFLGKRDLSNRARESYARGHADGHRLGLRDGMAERTSNAVPPPGWPVTAALMQYTPGGIALLGNTKGHTT